MTPTFSVPAVLRDGQSIRVRELRIDDKERLPALFAKLSPQSMYFRFFQAKHALTEVELTKLTVLDASRELALIASRTRGEVEEILGAGWSLREHPSSDRAEIAFAVADEHHGKGLGTLLLEHLADISRAQGVKVFEADVLGSNAAMLRVFSDSGFELQSAAASGVVHVSFSIEDAEQSNEAREERWAVAARESVRTILSPRSVAVVGASRREGTIGHALLSNLRERFRGRLFAVNPAAVEILGVPSVPSLGALGQAVDLAVIALPAEKVESAIDDCARSGVRGVVVISAGFAETSSEGEALQRRIRDRVRTAGMRMVGPNCIGVLNTDPELMLNATFGPLWPISGNVGMLSQSGAMGLALIDYTRPLGIGISTFVSVGNKADVSGNDLLAFWKDDPATRVVALYLESFGNPRKFARIARTVARLKPIVAVKSGRSEAGLRAAESHSAALASRDVAVDALFDQAGVIRTDTFAEMLDVIAFLSTQPLPLGSRIGVLTNAGGPAIMLADACEAQGLKLPKLTKESRTELGRFLPPEASLENPVDMIASAGPDAYRRALEILGADPAIDAVVAIHIPPFRGRSEEIATAIARGAGLVPKDKPVAVVFISSSGAPETLFSGPRGRLPCYEFPENAARAIAASARYARWRAEPDGTPRTLDRLEREAVRACIQRAFARESTRDSLWLRPEDVQFVLSAANIPCVAQAVARIDSPLEVAERLGFPLVAKAISPDVLHKTDAGLVILGIASPTELRLAVRQIQDRTASASGRLEGILLQKQVPRGQELLVGIAPDPTFGPLLIVGLGGIEAEVWRDTSFHLTPVTKGQAQTMLDELRAAKLLDAYRGRVARDKTSVVEILEQVSALAAAIPEIAELDLNPVMVGAAGEGSLVLDARIRVTQRVPLP